MPRQLQPLSPLRPKIRLSHPGNGIAILVVDDDEDYLDAVHAQVARIRGARVTRAASYDEAVEQLLLFPYQLVICDWSLASRTGPEVFHSADPRIGHGQKRRIPVMFMSGSEKVASTQGLRSFKHFEPVTFILKSLGPPMIRIMAENIVQRFNPRPTAEANCVYLS
jgi:CheY-like chemotaxis protein